MSRRDTIIIALLVNAGLLALLFMLAINPEDEVLTDQPDIAGAFTEARSPIVSVPSSEPIVLIDSSSVDEVDTFLKDLASENSVPAFLVDEEGYLSVQPEKKPDETDKKIVKKETPAPDDLNYVNVTVKRGDALEKIARNNGTTVEAIKKANQLATAKLSIGQVLRVPISSQPEKNSSKPVAIAPSPTKEAEKKSPAIEAQYYTIKSGDNPWKIAKQFNVKFEDLLKMNNLDEERARNLKIGDKVRVK